MFRNYLKIAFRSLWRNKLFSGINILGLALCMTLGAALLTGIRQNLDTDHFHPYPDRTFRLLTDAKTAERSTRWCTVPYSLGSYLRRLSAVETVVQVQQNNQKVEVLTDQGEVPVDVMFTDPAFFTVFGFRLEAGNAAARLSSPGTVLINRKVVSKLFGKRNPLGQSITFNGMGTFTVAGIIEQPRQLTHLSTEAVFSMQTALALERSGGLPKHRDQWDNYKTTATYALLRVPEQAVALNQMLARLSRRTGAAGTQTRLSFSAQPIEAITPWNPAIVNDWHAGVNWQAMRQYLLLAIALTLLAAFNYTSLSLARSLTRAREVGIRKASGAVRWQLMGQFLTESTLLAFLAMGLSCGCIYAVALLGWGNQSPASGSGWPDGWLLGGLLLYTVLTGVVAGLVPAWLLSAFQPVQVLRNLQTVRLFRGVSLHKILIVTQFAVTTMLMIFVVVLRDTSAQMTAEVTKDLPDNVVVMALKNEPASTLQLQISRLSQVRRVSATNQLPVDPTPGQCTLRLTKQPTPLIVASVNIDSNWLAVLRQTLRAGSNLPANASPTHEQYALVNETLARQLPGQGARAAVGQLIRVDSASVQVVGVVADTPNQLAETRPTVYRYRPAGATLLAIQTEPGSETAVAAACRAIWQKNISRRTPTVSFYRQGVVRRLNEGMGEIMAIFAFFCGLVMLVSCLGILGISAYAVEVRTREIGVRRALGAGNWHVIWTLTKDFVRLLLWAGLFGVPAGWLSGLFLRERITKFVDVGPLNLGLGFGLVLLVGLLTVLTQTYRATRINPADVLKSD